MFRLISLEILHHHVLGNTRLELCKDNGAGVDVNEIYTSVVIGVNGIGKSYLMRAIADIFSYLDALSRDVEIYKSPVGYKFYIKYKMGISVYEFTNMADGNQQDGLQETIPMWVLSGMERQRGLDRWWFLPGLLLLR